MANKGRTTTEFLRPTYFVCRIVATEIHGSDKLWTQCDAGGSFLTTEDRDRHEKTCRQAKKQAEHNIITSR